MMGLGLGLGLTAWGLGGGVPSSGDTLLLEDSSQLLLEDGGNILLEQ